MEKKFDIGTILSITHANLLTDIGNVYEILNWLLDDNLYTHQLPRACRFVTPFILAQHPNLSDWDECKPYVDTNNWESWLGTAKKMFGNKLMLKKIPNGVWTEIDPVEELEQMVGKEKIIKIVH